MYVEQTVSKDITNENNKVFKNKRSTLYKLT